MLTSTFNLTNVKCAGCVGKVQSRVMSLTNVNKAQVNLLDKTLVVYYLEAKDDQAVIETLASIGYGASLDKIEEHKTSLWWSVVLPFSCAIILMILTMNQHLQLPRYEFRSLALGLSYAAISLAIVFACGYRLLKSGYLGFVTLSFNMYSLILLGIASAWLYSLVVVLLNYYSTYPLMSHVYFDSSMMIIALVNLGGYLEERAKHTTTSAIRGLVDLLPDTTTVVIDEQEQLRATNLLRTGDIVRVKPGQKIPADGEIVSGASYLDEAMLTGESLPVYKTVGASVIGGALNTSGTFTFRVSAIGSNTLLANIIQLVKHAQLAKPKLAQLADTITQVFVPAIILIALISGGIWYYYSSHNSFYSALTIFMTVLLIACPCSVGLAIPVSLMVGVGRGAKNGILLRDPSCLTAVDKLDTIVFDKTGTLTLGKPQVIGVRFAPHISEENILAIAYQIERNSNHPLACAVTEYCSTYQQSLVLSDFEAINGCGVRALVAGKQYYVGGYNWLAELGLIKESKLIEASSYSQVYIADENSLLAVFELADEVKADAKEVISQLQELGFKTMMLTGDNLSTAQEIAGQLQLNEFMANCTPAIKINKIRELQSAGHVVAFVGDGINDAPSLMQANIGIAVGSGSDIAKQNAAVSLLRNDMLAVIETIKLAQQINRNMRQNLYGSFVYNTVAVLIAAGALYPYYGILLNPMLASVIMSLSSLSVILNALRLRALRS